MEIKQLQQEAIKGTELYLHYLKEKQVGSEAHLTKPPTILAPNCTKLLVDHVVRSPNGSCTDSWRTNERPQAKTRAK